MSDHRIPMLERDQVPPEIQTIYDAVFEARGFIPNMHKTVANVPPLAQGFVALLKPLMGEGALPAGYKELIAVRVASLIHCDYCMSSHIFLAAKQGIPQAQIDAVNDYEHGPFTEKEKLGFRCADRIHESAYALDDVFYAKLNQSFSDQEIIELIAVAAAFEFFPRFVTALRIPVTPIPESVAAK